MTRRTNESREQVSRVQIFIDQYGECRISDSRSDTNEPMIEVDSQKCDNLRTLPIQFHMASDIGVRAPPCVTLSFWDGALGLAGFSSAGVLALVGSIT